MDSDNHDRPAFPCLQSPASGGNQNYDVSKDVDLSKYKVVSIWCNRFSVNFAAAPLKEFK